MHVLDAKGSQYKDPFQRIYSIGIQNISLQSQYVIPLHILNCIRDNSKQESL